MMVKHNPAEGTTACAVRSGSACYWHHRQKKGLHNLVRGMTTVTNIWHGQVHFCEDTMCWGRVENKHGIVCSAFLALLFPCTLSDFLVTDSLLIQIHL